MGFPNAPEGVDLQEVENNSGLLTAVLAELSPPVTATPYEVKEYVDLHDSRTDGYTGHGRDQIERLFPSIRVFKSRLAIENPWNYFFRMCIGERLAMSDISDPDLHDHLEILADLNPELLPYPVICRSIFDTDPGSLFLALYRCLEVLYSYSSATDLARRLSIEHDWQHVAKAMELSTGWYPREESSLEKLLRHASHGDLENIISAISPEKHSEGTLSKKAARAIYELRNKLVHYRPAQASEQNDIENWTRIYVSMIGLLLDIYNDVFSRTE
ncbi:hypothetical protein [Roseivivax halodurans]|uniref:hypothetical protein n=1 Tax=Roseivivax halodurans TaxID=93683 RepID=UPI0012F83C08|nr:hypothetical protein [Roseivivax halodurans]